MAATVVNGQEVADGAFQVRPTPGVQRKCAHCEEEEEKEVQLKSNGKSPGRVLDPQLIQSLQASKGGGKPLPGDARQYMESRFGTDFSGVNIHTGEKAARLSRQLNAQAFTHGRDIYFNEGKFAPHTQSGKHLLAHELTHVLQQTGGAGSAGQVIQRQEEEASLMQRASIEVLDFLLPLGNGFYFEVTGGITWGYPIYTGGSAVIYVTRASQSRLHILVRKQGRLAFDTGVGGSVMLGRRGRAGTGERGWGVGAEAGANFMAGAVGTVLEEYSIPTGELLSFMGSQAIDTVLSATLVTSTLKGPVQDLLGAAADQYMTRQQIEGGLFAQGDAEAGIGLRRPTERFNERVGDSDGRHLRGSAWGPGDDRDFQGTTSTWDPLTFLNRFLGVFLSANASAQVVGGYEQQMEGNSQTHAIYLEGQIGAMIGIPIPVVSQILASLPPDAGGGVRLELVETPGEPTQIRAVVYLKQGEDQYYAGAAGQQNMVFNLTNLISVEELAEALRTGRLPSVGALSFANLMEKVSFFSRLTLGTQSRRLARFIGRQSGTRSLLSDAALRKASYTGGGELEVYLDYAGEMNGTDFMRVAERLLHAGGQAVDAVSSAEDFSSAYEKLSQFFSGYLDSEEFGELTDDLMDQLTITTAKLRIQLGLGVGASARLAKGAKVRGDISLVGGNFCELDIAALFGGRITLRSLLEKVGEIVNNPVSYLPNCPILSLIYGSGGGGASDSSGSEGTAGGPASGNSASGRDSGPAASGGTTGTASSPSRSRRREGAQAQSRSASSGEYNVTQNYPPDVPPLVLQILEVYGPLHLNTPRNARLELTMLMTTEHVARPFRVRVHVKVIEIGDGQIVLELTRAWWIEELRVGSDQGVRYHLEYNN